MDDGEVTVVPRETRFQRGHEIVEFPLNSLSFSTISMIFGDPPLSLWKPFPSAFALDLDIERPGDEGRLVLRTWLS